MCWTAARAQLWPTHCRFVQSGPRLSLLRRSLLQFLPSDRPLPLLPICFPGSTRTTSTTTLSWQSGTATCLAARRTSCGLRTRCCTRQTQPRQASRGWGARPGEARSWPARGAWHAHRQCTLCCGHACKAGEVCHVCSRPCSPCLPRVPVCRACCVPTAWAASSAKPPKAPPQLQQQRPHRRTPP